MVTTADLAWAAGIIDGEGCFHISRSRARPEWSDTFSLYIKVTMGHRPTIDRLKEIFALGSIHPVIQARYNDAWSWLVTSNNAGKVITQIEPFVFTKTEELDIAKRFLALPRRYREVTFAQLQAREKLWDEMRRAKPSFRFRNPEHDE